MATRSKKPVKYPARKKNRTAGVCEPSATYACEPPTFEFDIIAYDGDTIVIVEVKTTLRPQDVKEFLNSLSQVHLWMPAYAGKRVCGAVAYLQEAGKATVMAEKSGLFTIRATGSSASITNSPTFKPKVF